jgi:hypothetical protein
VHFHSHRDRRFHFLFLGSDIVHVELFGTHIVVLNSEKAATDLLEKRSSIYSDRCGLPTGTRLIT